jgi:hypothetical protein
MAIFNSYVSLPEGNHDGSSHHPAVRHWISGFAMFQGAEWANPPGSECGHTSDDACATCVAKSHGIHHISSGFPRNDDVKCNYLGMTIPVVPHKAVAEV